MAVLGNVFQMAREMVELDSIQRMQEDLKRAVWLYEKDLSPLEVVSFCQDFLRYLYGQTSKNGFNKEEKRTTKVLISYYATGNPSLAYQQCLNIRNKYFSE